MRFARGHSHSATTSRDPRYLANQDDSGSELILPVLRDGKVVGTVDIESNEVGAFDGTLIASHQRYAEALAALWDGSRP
jgi:putative methionine-R-sulfoxide reductase with GAF domain